MLRLREEWQTLPAAYSVANRLFTLYRDNEAGDWIFRIGAFPAEEKDKLPEGFVLFDEQGAVCYAAAIAESEAPVSLEEIHRLFYLLAGEDAV